MNNVFLEKIKKVVGIESYIIAYLIFSSVNMITLINVINITRFFLVIFGIWAMAICVYFYIIKRDFHKKNIVVLILLLVTCCISELVNFRYGGFSSLAKLYFFGISILLIYAQGNNLYDNCKKLFDKIDIALSLIITCALFSSILMYIFEYSSAIVLRTGVTAYLGVYENRLNGVFSSSNVGGMYAVISIFLVIYRMFCMERKKIVNKGLDILQLIVALTFISVTLSRGTFVSLFCFFSVYIILYRNNKNNFFITIIVKKLAVLIALVILLAGSTVLLRNGLIKLVEIHNNLLEQKKAEVLTNEEENLPTGDSVESIDLISEPGKLVPDDTTDIVETIDSTSGRENLTEQLKLGFSGRIENSSENTDITNKRKDIWIGNLLLLNNTRNILFGVNNPYIYMNAMSEEGIEFSHYQKVWVEWASGNMHNGYIQILVNCGVIPLVLFLIYLVLSLKEVVAFFRKVKESKDIQKYNVFACCISFVAVILVNNIFESNMALYGTNFFQNMFWFVAGICYCIFDSINSKG